MKARYHVKSLNSTKNPLVEAGIIVSSNKYQCTHLCVIFVQRGKGRFRICKGAPSSGFKCAFIQGYC